MLSTFVFKFYFRMAFFNVHLTIWIFFFFESVLATLKIWAVSLLLNCKNSLNILDMSFVWPSVMNIFFQHIVFLAILMEAFKKKTIHNLEEVQFTILKIRICVKMFVYFRSQSCKDFLQNYHLKLYFFKKKVYF